MDVFSWKYITEHEEPVEVYLGGQLYMEGGGPKRDISPEAKRKDLERVQLVAIKEALARLKQYARTDALLLQIEQGNPLCVTNLDARAAVLDLIQGKGPGSGRKMDSQSYWRNLRICMLIYYLNKYCAIPVYNIEETGNTACELVAQHVHLSRSSIYKIWRQYEKSELITERNFIVNGLFDVVCIARGKSNPPTPEDIIEYLWNGEIEYPKFHWARGLDSL